MSTTVLETCRGI